MFKYADDTYVYIVIPARNTQSRRSELDNVSKWALANNLRLNKAKYVEIIFTVRRRKLQICQPHDPGYATCYLSIGVRAGGLGAAAPNIWAVRFLGQ